MRLGCIGDDFTGSSDLANTLAKGGMRTVQYTGVPDEPAGAEVDAGVVALKSRSIAPRRPHIPGFRCCMPQPQPPRPGRPQTLLFSSPLPAGNAQALKCIGRRQ